MKSEQPQTKKWYKSNPGIIALIILFFPVGIYLMWRYAPWKKWLKITVSAVYALFSLVVLIAALNPQPYITVNDMKNNRIETDSASYRLTGNLSGLVDGVTVTVNGDVAERDGRNFSIDLDLEDGDNKVVIESSIDDKSQREELIIYKTPEAELEARRAAEAKRLAEEEAARKKAEEDARKKDQNDEANKTSDNEPSQETKPTESSPSARQTDRRSSVVSNIADEAIKSADGGYCYAEYLEPDESQFVSIASMGTAATYYFVKSSEKVLASNKCREYTFVYSTNGESSRGTTQKFALGMFGVNRTKFDSYNWTNLSGQSIGEQLNRDGILNIPANVRGKIDYKDFRYNG